MKEESSVFSPETQTILTFPEPKLGKLLVTCRSITGNVTSESTGGWPVVEISGLRLAILFVNVRSRKKESYENRNRYSGSVR